MDDAEEMLTHRQKRRNHEHGDISMLAKAALSKPQSTNSPALCRACDTKGGVSDTGTSFSIVHDAHGHRGAVATTWSALIVSTHHNVAHSNQNRLSFTLQARSWTENEREKERTPSSL